MAERTKLKTFCISVIFLFICGLVMSGGITTTDVDELCYTDGHFLLRLAGLWKCHDFNSSVEDITETHYAELYNWTAGGFLFPITHINVWYNLTGVVQGEINGFIVTENAPDKGGTFLTATKSGVYGAHFIISGQASASGGIYTLAISKNHDVTLDDSCLVKKEGTGTVDQPVVFCVLDITKGDNITGQILQNNAPPKAFTVNSINFNIHQVD